ncbi:MAG: sulfite exporter TauE/SafE family protein, partial [Pollutimonas bauzanensis]
MISYGLVLALGLIAGAISGVIGTGSSIILLPVLAITFGPKQAVPIMAIAAILGNISRVLVWFREIDWRAVLAYSAAGVPAAALGARTLISLPNAVIDLILGGFFLLMIPARRALARREYTLTLGQLALIGLFVGFLTGLVISTGPLSVPAFLAYGLTGGAFIATEAASAFMLYVSKAATFQSLGALPGTVILNGAIVGLSLAAGTFISKVYV